MLDRAQPVTIIRSPLADRPPRRDPFLVRAIVWILVAAFVGTLGDWAYWQGMRLRDETWTNSRTIRFHGDIRNGIRWGTLVLRTAERVANAEPNATGKPRPTARAVVTPGANERPLTFYELLRGVDQVYQDFVVGESPDGDYGLDYPPLRLLSMTLWTRHVRHQIPDLEDWPGPWKLSYSDTGDPSSLISEDIAYPMLLANTYSIAATAVFVFFLVWIWVNRGGRPTLPQPRRGWTAWFAPRKQLAPWKPTPLRRTNGLLVFPLAAAAFFYAMVIAENPVPAPAPTIAYSGRPLLTKSATGRITASIISTVDGQGSDAQWALEWGATPRYGKQTDYQDAGGDEVTATLTDLRPNQTIHYRVTAKNDRGITHTDDAEFNTSDILPPLPPRDVFGQVWLSWPQWLGVALLFLAMTTSIGFLPPRHRGWAAGLVAALLLWLDPSVLVDAHIWPQWDVWVLPPFFLAALLTTLDWWFTAGLVLGVGVMFKGQTMLAAPVLFIWPLLSGRWGALARTAVGFVTAAGLVLSPWLVLNNTNPDFTAGPLRWIPGVLAAGLIAGALSFYRRPIWRRAVSVWHELRGGPAAQAAQATAPQTSIFDLTIFCSSLLAGIVLITILILRRWPVDSDLSPRVAGLLLLLGVLVPPWFLPRRAMGVWLAAVLGCTIWMSAYLYHGDWSWKTVGFEYGTRKFTRMALGIGSNGNLAQILETRFGWDVHDPALPIRLPDIAHPLGLASPTADPTNLGWTHDWGLDGTPATLDIRQFLMFVFVTMIFLAGAGAAVQARRNDPRFLASLAAIWVLMPNILCQMAARYQMWAAAASCLVIGISSGLTLLHVVVSLLAAGMIGAQLLQFDASRSPLIHDMMSRFGPDDGWIMIIIGLIYLYTALAPARRTTVPEWSLT